MQDYSPVHVLGRGSYGQAVLVTEKGSGLKRVIKEIDFARLPERAQKEAQTEVGVLKALSHPHIVAYVDMFFQQRRKLCIVMEFADGGDLADNIKARRAEGLHFQEHEAFKIFGQCCSALQFVHARKILHRDLKCGNIFLTRGGDVKLGDFGIAKVLDNTVAEAKTMIGTPTYLAPEICNSEPYGMKADVWSMGVVLYEMLALEPPFTGVNLAALVMKIIQGEPKPLPGQYSDEATGLVARMLDKDVERRPSIDRILAMPMLRGGAGMKPASRERSAEPRAEDWAPPIRTPSGRSSEMDAREQALDAAEPHPRKPSAKESSASCSAESWAAREYHRNREMAAQARARAQGEWGLQYARQGQRGRGDDSCFNRSPSGSRQDQRRQSGGEHIMALQEAASQSRRDRGHAKQKRVQEFGWPDPLADAAPRGHGGKGAADRRRREDAQLVALQEAAAQSRRDRKEVQHRMLELERASSMDCSTPRGGGSVGHGEGEAVGPRRPCPLSKKQKEEQEHLHALQEAAAQARDERRQLQRKRESLEAQGNSCGAFFCDIGQGADVGASTPRASHSRLSLQPAHPIDPQDAKSEALQEHLELRRSGPEVGSSASLGRRRVGSVECSHAADALLATEPHDAPGGSAGGERGVLALPGSCGRRSNRSSPEPDEAPTSSALRPQSSDADSGVVGGGKSRLRSSTRPRSPSLGAVSSRLAFAGGLLTGSGARPMSVEPDKSCSISLNATGCESLQLALREAKKDMEDTEQLERNWDSPGSFLQPFRGGLPSGVIAAALAAAESPQSVPLPPRPPKLPRGPGAHPVGQQAADVTPPPSELPSARSEEPKSSFLTAGLLSKMMGFEPIPITDDIGMNDSLSYSMTMTKSLGSSWH